MDGTRRRDWEGRLASREHHSAWAVERRPSTAARRRRCLFSADLSAVPAPLLPRQHLLRRPGRSARPFSTRRPTSGAQTSASAYARSSWPPQQPRGSWLSEPRGGRALWAAQLHHRRRRPHRPPATASACAVRSPIHLPSLHPPAGLSPLLAAGSTARHEPFTGRLSHAAAPHGR